MNRYQILALVARESLKCSYYGLVLEVFNRKPKFLLRLESMRLDADEVIKVINDGL